MRPLFLKRRSVWAMLPCAAVIVIVWMCCNALLQDRDDEQPIRREIEKEKCNKRNSGVDNVKSTP